MPSLLRIPWISWGWTPALTSLQVEIISRVFWGFFKYNWFTMLCYFLVYSKVIQIYSFSYSFPYGILEDIEYGSLCFIVGPCCLSILYVVVHICRRQWRPTPVLLPGRPHGRRSLVGCSLWCHEKSDTTEWLHFHALEKEMATHSSVLAWRILGTTEPGGLPSLGSHRVRHDWSDLAAAAVHIC